MCHIVIFVIYLSGPYFQDVLYSPLSFLAFVFSTRFILDIRVAVELEPVPGTLGVRGKRTRTRHTRTFSGKNCLKKKKKLSLIFPPKHFWNISRLLQTSQEPERGHTSLLEQDDDEAGEDLQDLSHDHSGRGEEAVSRQRPHVTDAEDERGILDHQYSQTDVLQLPVRCRGTNKRDGKITSKL